MASRDIALQGTMPTVASDASTPESCPVARWHRGLEQSRRARKKMVIRFRHWECILRLGRLRLRGPQGAQDDFVLTDNDQNLRRLASLSPDHDLLTFCASRTL
ncbi:hypothetical protein CQ10_31320 [Bradyrhizobium valentinum]|uniref:Uncharacterized protein n=1 Tax=Bradyrhizobium valentinum TaxID=1518501 RepID=A0A0R3LGI9_9BRAD|nr:hypothetical protein CQ10_31320 [Bradyrhizobium valentinum]KRR04355.1 hypothetical protein CP49_21435 [Bradyrhizobium valentinum]